MFSKVLIAGIFIFKFYEVVVYADSMDTQELAPSEVVRIYKGVGVSEEDSHTEHGESKIKDATSGDYWVGDKGTILSPDQSVQRETLTR